MLNKTISRWLAVIFFSGLAVVASGQGLPTLYRPIVKRFINVVKHNDWAKLAVNATFPLCREYPIPSIDNPTAFRARCRDVFDDSLRQMITKSDLVQDWAAVGWRGIMLGNGQVWLDYEGRLIAVNYQSKMEARLLAHLVAADKGGLYPGLRDFSKPVLEMETRKFRIRIDKMDDGTFRYASWPVDQAPSEAPALVINNGKLDYDGDGGNCRYTFENSGYTYECDILGAVEGDAPPAKLIVQKGDSTLKSEPAKTLKGG